ncbi:hypothetical protein [Streptomyces sp. NPDC047869]|uniref:hypothetical protein n=1 Tax=Streptomyces sp. NPDC047869 TaxID=3154709 RepID=UPI0034572811
MGVAVIGGKQGTDREQGEQDQGERQEGGQAGEAGVGLGAVSVHGGAFQEGCLQSKA